MVTTKGGHAMSFFTNRSSVDNEEFLKISDDDQKLCNLMNW